MNENYIGYQAMLTGVSTGISQLSGVCRHISMEKQAEELKGIENRLKQHIFSVGIMGEFKRGKSTVINALLGQEIVPADIVPCSATLNYVKWDSEKGADVFFKNGTTKKIAVEELSKYVTKITKESEEMAKNVDKVVVYYPCQFCQNGVQIIDTPGLNDNERMSEISENVIPTLDAIIMVITPDSPFSQSEAEFVRNKVMTSDLGRIIFVINKIDTVDEDDRERLISSIREKIRNSVLEKMGAVYGEDSVEYKNAYDKIGEIRLIPVSAKRALKGKIKNDRAMLEDSGYTEFENALSHLLTEERGILELMHPVNQICSVSGEAMKIIDTRLNTLNMEAEEFEKKQKVAMLQLRETRERKKEEIDALKNKGLSLYASLLPEVAGIYDEIEGTLSEYVGSYDLSSVASMDKAQIEGFVEKFSRDIDSKMNDILSVHTERLIYRVQEQLGKDIEGLERFGQEFSATLNDIHLGFSEKKNSAVSVVTSTLVDVGITYASIYLLGNFVPGIGGLITGFRDHGVKGAVVGGLSGVAAGSLALAAAAAAGVVGLPLALIMGAAATFGGKAITRLVFGAPSKKDTKTDKIRENIENSVNKMMMDFRKSGALEDWLKGVCERSYNDIANDIDKEWENSLDAMENTLTQIRIDLEMSAVNKEKTESDLRNYFSEITELMTAISPIKKKLSHSLNK